MHGFVTNLKTKIDEESQKEQEKIDQIMAEWGPNE